MKKIVIQCLWLLMAICMIACGSKVSDGGINGDVPEQKDTLAQAEIEMTVAYEDAVNQGDDDYETSYVVIADTGTDYDYLHRKMFVMSQMLDYAIDTMGRSYDEMKDLIALPEDDDDEIYAGTYFPRRFASESLSLEYLRFYHKNAGTKTIALVSGMYAKESSADSALMELRRIEKNAFMVKAIMYVGCMH